MSATTILVLLLGATAQQAAEHTRNDEAAKARSQRLLELHTGDAATFSFFRDAERTQKLQFEREPVYRWTNPTRSGGQEGEVFVWTYRGRPEVVASVFSHPRADGTRTVNHELHSLSQVVLVVDRKASEQWVPQAAGVDLKPVEGAPKPAGSASPRLAQMRSLAREFNGRSQSASGETWELRLLPHPLYRYESTDPDVLDGALFALVSTAGTDPEILFLLEARKAPSDPQWVFGAARFSDMSLWLSHSGHEVWSAVRSEANTFTHDAKHRYRFYRDRIILELGDKSPG
ncbi:MAG: hypothetical protein ACHRXM_30130 [Isosphaerales bacterium]